MLAWIESLRAHFAPHPLPPVGARTLVDVRSPGEYAAGHLPDALSLPLDTLGTSAAAALPDRSAALVVYCHSGMRARIACRQLTKMGYTRCIYGGGMTALKHRL